MQARAFFRAFSATEKQIKGRIKAVISIEKITKAMKMVATSKMKLDVNHLEKGRGFGDDAFDLMLKSDTYLQKKIPHEVANPSILVIPFSSDRGLCGSVNTNVYRELRSYLGGVKRENVQIMPIGEKAVNTLTRKYPEMVISSISEVDEPVNFMNICAIAQQIKTASDKKDKIVLIYNEYKNSITYSTKKLEIMTFSRFFSIFKHIKKYDTESPDNEHATMIGFYDLYLSSNLYQAWLQSKASEQSSRMTAMESASKNAKELVEKLQLQMNKARQFHITMELMEIISGANSI